MQEPAVQVLDTLLGGRAVDDDRDQRLRLLRTMPRCVLPSRSNSLNSLWPQVLIAGANKRQATERYNYEVARLFFKVPMLQAKIAITANCAVITAGQMREISGSKYFWGPNDTKAERANKRASEPPKRALWRRRWNAAAPIDSEAPRNGPSAKGGTSSGGCGAVRENSASSITPVSVRRTTIAAVTGWFGRDAEISEFDIECLQYKKPYP